MVLKRKIRTEKTHVHNAQAHITCSLYWPLMIPEFIHTFHIFFPFYVLSLTLMCFFADCSMVKTKDYVKQ